MIVDYLSAKLFSKLRSVGFYREAHTGALSYVPDGAGLFLDVGCASGMISVEATKKGYRVIGIDKNQLSIEAAKKYAELCGVNVDFKAIELSKLDFKADVVCASSLLAVMPDRVAGLKALFGAVKKGGYLVVIEPTGAMTVKNGRSYAKRHNLKQRQWLCMWAFARQNNIVDSSIYELLGAEKIDCDFVLDGMLGVWIIKK